MLGLLLQAGAAAAALTPQTNFWAPNGDVYQVSELPPPGAGMGISADPATPAQSDFDFRYSRIRGTVYAAISDASGGWFVGGDFDQIDGVPRKYIAHLDAVGRLDTSWQVALNGPVYTMLLDSGLIYIGGDFTTANDLARNHLALIAASTGQVSETWGPAADGRVSALVISDNLLVAGGQFTQLGGGARHYLGAVDKNTSTLSSWNPNLDGAVMALARSGDTLFVGGSFSQAGGAAHGNFAAVSLSSAASVTGWVFDTDQPVSSLLVDGAQLYIGGDFTVLGSSTRHRLAAVHIGASSGAVTAWNPDVDGVIDALAVAGDSLYVGGAFSHIGSSARTHLAAIDTLSGAATVWNPGWSGAAVIRALAWQKNATHANGVLFAGGDQNDDGGKVYLAGHFSYVGPPTGGGAVIPADPLLPMQDQPVLTGAHIVGTVEAAVGDGSGGWYIGGSFSFVDGMAVANLAHIRGDGTLDATWTPSADGAVYSLVLSGGTLYLGGAFTQVNATPRNRLAALDSVGVLQAWDPDADGDVRTMIASGGLLYLGGAFTQVGGQPRNRLAAVAVASGALQATWHPDADGDVLAMGVSGATLYLGGSFTQVAAQPRNHGAAVDVASGVLQAWDPNANGDVRALAVLGTTVYLGGTFTQVNALTRNHLAAWDTTLGTLAAWDPDADGNVDTIAIATSISGATLYLGGDFLHIGVWNRTRLAAVDDVNGLPTDWSPTAGSTVRTLAWQTNASYSTGVVYCGGRFASLGGEVRENVAVLDRYTGELLSWAPSVKGVVRAMALSPDAQRLYIGGEFTEAAGLERLHLAALDTNSGLGLDWARGADGNVAALALSSTGASLFVGGDFTHIAGQGRDYLALIQTANGIPVEWHPILNGPVRALARTDTALYVGGAFTTAIGQARERIAMLDVSKLLLTNWRPQIDDNEVLSILPDPDRSRVYVGGSFTKVAGAPNDGVAAFEQSSAALIASWMPALDGAVNALSLMADGTRIYVGGDFQHSGLQATPYLVSVASADGSVNADWTPALDGHVRDLASSVDGSRIYVGGGFLSEAGALRPRVTDLLLPGSESVAPTTTVTPPGGVYNKDTQSDLVLTCDDGSGSGCEATYVTTDGSAPRIAPNLRYTDPILLNGDLTLRFFSVDRQGNREAEHLANYQVDLIPPTSSATPGSEIYFGKDLTVTLQCHDKDDQGVSGSGCTDIFYTTDGSLPTTASSRYAEPITISGAITLRYLAVDAYGNVEGIHREEYVRNRAGIGGFGPFGFLLLVWALRHRRNALSMKGTRS